MRVSLRDTGHQQFVKGHGLMLQYGGRDTGACYGLVRFYMVAIDWGRHVPWEILKQGHHHCGAKRERIVIMISVERKNLVLILIIP